MYVYIYIYIYMISEVGIRGLAASPLRTSNLAKPDYVYIYIYI